MRFEFSFKYLLLTITLFVVEVLIATIGKKVYLLRAYGGDVLVVILLYTFVRTFFYVLKEKLVLWIFLFAVFVETVQYFKLASRLGFKPGSAMYIILGNSFSWGDIASYAIGCTLVLLAYRMSDRGTNPREN